jgi:hypothetical protein
VYCIPCATFRLSRYWSKALNSESGLCRHGCSCNAVHLKTKTGGP